MRKLLFCFMYALLLTVSASAQFLIENKGQWPQQVLFRAEFSDATLYIEENGITMDLLDPEEQAQISDAHHLHDHALRLVPE